MATTIPVSCPECHKQIKAPADLQGKKIRCKGCGHIFVVQGGPPPKPAPKKKDPAVPAAGPIPIASDEDDANPYIMTDTSLKARCPHCAVEMEGEGAVICLNCGYNTITRQRHEAKVTAKRGFMEWALWLLPGIACVLFVVCCGAADLIYIIPGGLGNWLNEKSGTEVFTWRAFKFWGTVTALFFIFFAGRFAFKRLVLNPVPPEKVVKRGKREED